MRSSTPEELAQELAAGLASFHAAELHGSDIELRNAVIVKTVALVGLAYEIPPTSDGDYDVPDMLMRLTSALATIAKKRDEAVTH